MIENVSTLTLAAVMGFSSPKIPLIMFLSNIFSIIIGRYTIQERGLGPSLPLPNAFKGFGLPELLATVSLGHILGAGIILGLQNIGILQ